MGGVEENLRGYQYDANGNMVAKSNRFMVSGSSMTLVEEGLGVECWKYGYDVEGMRVASQEVAITTHYVYSYGGKVIHEKSYGDKNSVQNYIIAISKMIAEVKGISVECNEVSYYYLVNLSSTRVVANLNGEIISEIDYLSFGKKINGRNAESDEHIVTHTQVNVKKK